MGPKEKIERLAQTAEDRIFALESLGTAVGRPEEKYPGYQLLPLSQRAGAGSPPDRRKKDLTFLEAIRERSGRLPAFFPLIGRRAWGDDGPVACIRAQFFVRDRLTHRDFLGSLMGAGIKRETVGDICVGEGSCDFFLLTEMVPYVLQNLDYAGRTKLQLQRISLCDVRIPEPETKIIRDTVASCRLDSVISAGFRMSRARAAEQICSGAVAIDGLPCEKPDRQMEAGCVISLRGMGKIRLLQVLGQTRKGRLSVEIEQYM